MGERKIFAGGRIRRARQRLGLNQTQMAERLGLSPSYLNLMERNQRPLTVQVLVKLSTVFDLDIAELSSEDDSGAVEALKEVFADPLLQGELPGSAEIVDLVDAAPNAAAAITRLHDAYREALGRLSDLGGALSGGDAAAGEGALRLPRDRVARVLEERGRIEAMEALAEEIAAQLSPRDDPAAALRAHLKQRHGIDIRILPDHVMPSEQARFDRHSMRLFLSERLRGAERNLAMARQAALLGGGVLLDRLTREAELEDAETRRLYRAALALRLADAILMPETRLREAAAKAGTDVALLARRFATGPGRVMGRIAALGGEAPLPATTYVAVDASGAVLARLDGAGMPLARYGPLCPRLPLFDPRIPERPEAGAVIFPDGSEYDVVACREDGMAVDGLAAPRRLSLIAWKREGAPGGSAARPVGVTCRLCERSDCSYRASAPATRPAAFDEHLIGPSHHATTPFGTPC